MVVGISEFAMPSLNLKEKLFTTGIPIQHLAEPIRERVHSKRVLIVLDACHSGAASGESKGLQRTANVDASAFAQGTGQACDLLK